MRGASAESAAQHSQGRWLKACATGSRGQEAARRSQHAALPHAWRAPARACLQTSSCWLRGTAWSARSSSCRPCTLPSRWGWGGWVDGGGVGWGGLNGGSRWGARRAGGGGGGREPQAGSSLPHNQSGGRLTCERGRTPLLLQLASNSRQPLSGVPLVSCSPLTPTPPTRPSGGRPKAVQRGTQGQGDRAAAARSHRCSCSNPGACRLASGRNIRVLRA